MAIPDRFQSGFRLTDGDAIDTALATPQWQTNYGITALGTALASTTPALVLGHNVVTTSTASNYGVVLPSAVAGSIVYFYNADSADAVTVFGAGSDTINGTAGSTGVSYAAAKRVLFIAVNNGVWIANVLAAS
jgi:hypothetical protein